MTQPQKLKEGDARHIKGFILNKLYLGGYFSRGKKHHGKHTDVDNLPKGYPIEHRGKFAKIVKELKRGGFIIIFPSGGARHVCAFLESKTIEVGLVFCNAWREAVGLFPLDKKFREIVKIK